MSYLGVSLSSHASLPIRVNWRLKGRERGRESLFRARRNIDSRPLFFPAKSTRNSELTPIIQTLLTPDPFSPHVVDLLHLVDDVCAGDGGVARRPFAGRRWRREWFQPNGSIVDGHLGHKHSSMRTDADYSLAAMTDRPRP